MDYIEALRAILADTKQDALAEELGTTQPNISRWLKGSEPRGPMLDKIRAAAKSRGIGSEDELPIKPLNESAGDVASLDIHAGMGNGGLQSVMRADGETRIAPEYLKGHWSFPDPVKAMWQGMENTYAFPVTGDSMSPTLESGCYVFVDTKHVHPAPADIYVVDFGDGLMVKRIELVPMSDMVKVISDNSRYTDYDLHRQDLNVFGRVVAWFQWRG